MEDLQKSFVDVRLALKAVLDFVDVVDGVVELHRLVVLNGWPSWGPAEWWVKLHGRGARRGVRRDGRIALTAWCQCLGLKRLKKTNTLKDLELFHQWLDHKWILKKLEPDMGITILSAYNPAGVHRSAPTLDYSPCSSWPGWSVSAGEGGWWLQQVGAGPDVG